jgi:hypothetical protein
MTKNKLSWPLLCLCATLILVSGAALADDAPANVAGTWTVSVPATAGTLTQTLVIQQDGAKITGTFKGPRQSGTLDGTVTGNTVSFHVTAGTPLDYTGTAAGDSMKGTVTGNGKTGAWTAARAK